MAQLQWDNTGDRLYETGDRNVALYVYNETPKTITDTGHITNYYNGVAWNGVTAITESPSGAEPTDLWADDIKYATLRSAEQFGGTIEAYTFPEEFEECDGSKTINGVTLGQQTRKAFGLAYITTVGNDTKLNDYGEKLHIVYNATASPSERSYATINDSPEAITFSWEFTTTAVDAGEDYKKVSCVTIDSNKAGKDRYDAFKTIVFGSLHRDDQAGGAYLPMPADILEYFGGTSVYTYTVQSTEPEDWETNYMDYYTRSGESPNYKYTLVGYQGTNFPFTADTYYKRTITE